MTPQGIIIELYSYRNAGKTPREQPLAGRQREKKRCRWTMLAIRKSITEALVFIGGSGMPERMQSRSVQVTLEGELLKKEQMPSRETVGEVEQSKGGKAQAYQHSKH